MVSVDGTDCRIHEPTPFSTRWYSHKCKGAGLRYEVGVTISSGQIVWAHGPFPCGSHPDLLIVRMGLKKELLEGERVIADCGYQDERCILPTTNDDSKPPFSGVRARHEIVSRRSKQFNVLSDALRHDKSLHSSCFHAVCNLRKVLMNLDDTCFDVF